MFLIYIVSNLLSYRVALSQGKLVLFVMHGRLVILMLTSLLQYIGSKRKSSHNGSAKVHFSVLLGSITLIMDSALMVHYSRYWITLTLHLGLAMLLMIMPATTALCWRSSLNFMNYGIKENSIGMSRK
jgi:hypothetical protein